MKNRYHMARLLVGFIAAFNAPSSALAAVSYLVDDGTITHSVGVGAPGGDLIALNRFTTQVGGEDITNIQINWTGIANGTNATLVIYDDPNDDGNPNDLVLLNQVNVTTSGGGGFNNSFTDHLFPNTSVTGEFYVGALVSGMAATDFPFGYDATNPDFPGVSFFFENTTAGDLDVSNPNGTSTLSGFSENFITSGNFMIRATGIEGALLPEPSSALLLLLSGIFWIGSRRRHFDFGK